MQHKDLDPDSDETLHKKGQRLAKNAKIRRKRAARTNEDRAREVKFSRGVSCRVPDGLGAIVSPGHAKRLNSCFVGGLGEYLYCSTYTNIN